MVPHSLEWIQGCGSLEHSHFIIERAANGKQGIVSLLNLSFWMGAGFSKSWDDQYLIEKKIYSPLRQVNARIGVSSVVSW